MTFHWSDLPSFRNLFRDKRTVWCRCWDLVEECSGKGDDWNGFFIVLVSQCLVSILSSSLEQLAMKKLSLLSHLFRLIYAYPAVAWSNSVSSTKTSCFIFIWTYTSPHTNLSGIPTTGYSNLGALGVHPGKIFVFYVFKYAV